MKRIWLRVTAFVLIFIMLLSVVQDVLKKKWYYPNWELNTYKTTHDIYDLEENSVDVLFLGTSHMEYGVSPMEIYGYNNIVSYNLGTTAQSIEVSYYLANEFMKKQNPKVVMLDSSNLFYDTSEGAAWRYVLDSMKFSTNKIEFGLDYANNESVNCTDDLLSTFVPMYKYHSRWKELSGGDFFLNPNKSFMNGYYMWSGVKASPCTVEVMNNEMGYFSELETDGGIVYEYEADAGIDNYDVEYIIDISDEITDKAEFYLKKIIELCQQNDCQLILTKVPSMYFPQFYNGAWTLKKYNEARRIAEKYQLDFVDILYDENLDIDWNTDSGDGGKHLNILGAEKVSRYYADYLQNVCQINGKQVGKYDADLLKYNEVKEVAILVAQNDFETYIQELQNRENTIILISTTNNFAQGMSESQFIMFKKMFEDDYVSEQLYRYSFIGIIDSGEIMYKIFSQGDMEYCYETVGKKFNLKSAGIQNVLAPSIKLNETELSQENNGIDIVVYDKDTKCVIDSVSFEFADGNCYTHRADGNAKNLDEYIYSIGG